MRACILAWKRPSFLVTAAMRVQSGLFLHALTRVHASVAVFVFYAKHPDDASGSVLMTGT